MSFDSHRFFVGKHLIVLGCGYVGGELARQAAARGLKVTALTRNPDKIASLRGSGVDIFRADLAGTDWHEQVPTSADFVLNCVSSGGGGVQGYQRSYVAGMQSVAEWSRRAKIGTLVYTGSTSVYPQDNGSVVDETALTLPAELSDRGKLLLEAENILRHHVRCKRWFILRLAGIYGPGRHHILDQLRAGESLTGSGEHRLNLVHRDDICAAIWAALAASSELSNQIYNVADDTPATKHEVATWLADRLGLPAPHFDPAAVSTRRRVVPDRTILNAKLKAQLDWQPAYPDYRAGYESILAAL